MIHVLIRPIKTGSPNIKEEKKNLLWWLCIKGHSSNLVSHLKLVDLWETDSNTFLKLMQQRPRTFRSENPGPYASHNATLLHLSLGSLYSLQNTHVLYTTHTWLIRQALSLHRLDKAPTKPQKTVFNFFHFRFSHLCLWYPLSFFFLLLYSYILDYDWQP